jgi:hypothetical protein
MERNPTIRTKRERKKEKHQKEKYYYTEFSFEKALKKTEKKD